VSFFDIASQFGAIHGAAFSRDNRATQIRLRFISISRSEWIWHGRLENDPTLQAEIMGASGSESEWNKHVNRSFSDFPLILELCNGSKHFERDSRDKVQATHRAGYGSSLFALQ